MSNQERRGPSPEVAAATAARLAAYDLRRSASASTILAPPSASVDLDQVRADAAAAERARILDIMSSPEARANPALAMELAYRQSRPAAEALATLRVFCAADSGSVGSAAPTTRDAIDASWDAVAERLNADAGYAGPTAANSSAEPWDDIITKLNGEVQR